MFKHDILFVPGKGIGKLKRRVMQHINKLNQGEQIALHCSFSLEEDNHHEMNKIRSDWPQAPSPSVLSKSAENFRIDTSNTTLEEVTCMCCAKSLPVSLVNQSCTFWHLELWCSQ